jgi:hypothetical protein
MGRLIDSLIAQGYTFRIGGNGHWQVRQEGKLCGTLPASPSDVRTWRNTIRDLRRSGFQWPPPPKKGHRK